MVFPMVPDISAIILMCGSAEAQVNVTLEGSG